MTVTDSAHTKHKQENTDRKETTSLKPNNPRVGNFGDRLWGKSMIAISEAVIIRTYEYSGEHEVMWTPNGSEIWPPFLEE